jgi:hypothetical protein
MHVDQGTQLHHVLKECADLADIDSDSSPSKLPRPFDSDRCTDIKFRSHTANFQGIISDVSLTHPFIGDADDHSTWGNYKPTAMKDHVEEKVSKYLQWHNDQGYMFLPLVCSTFGAISAMFSQK